MDFRAASVEGDNMKTLWFSCVAVSFCVLQIGCSKQVSKPSVTGSVQPAIVNGQAVSGTESFLKHVVGLAKYDSKGRLLGIFCTGTVIAEDLILTAAHCVTNIEKTAVIFEPDLGKAAERGQFNARPVEDGFVHPRYIYQGSVSRAHNDIALVYFSGGLPEGIEPADLMFTNRSLTKGSLITLAGWGRLSDTSQRTPTRLHKKSVSVLYIDPLYTEVIFDQTDGGACNGDSGGPAFIHVNGRDVVAAVASRVMSDRESTLCSQYAVYTLVEQHIDFLTEAAKALSPRF